MLTEKIIKVNSIWCGNSWVGWPMVTVLEHFIRIEWKLSRRYKKIQKSLMVKRKKICRTSSWTSDGNQLSFLSSPGPGNDRMLFFKKNCSVSEVPSLLLGSFPPWGYNICLCCWSQSPYLPVWRPSRSTTKWVTKRIYFFWSPCTLPPFTQDDLDRYFSKVAASYILALHLYSRYYWIGHLYMYVYFIIK